MKEPKSINDVFEQMKKACFMKQTMVRPFHCGAQYYDWIERNCLRCTKGYAYRLTVPACELEEELASACVLTGEIDSKTAERIGYFGNENALTWDCPEREVSE